MKKGMSILMSALMLSSILPVGGCAEAAPETKYIPAPYTAETEEELTAEIFTPVYYENENGPTIGVTLIGVIESDGLYFRDIDNDQELDPCEDWRLTPEERTADLISKMSLYEKAKIVFNNTGANPSSTTMSEVSVKDGKVSFTSILGSPVGDVNDPYFNPLAQFSYLSILDGIRAGIYRKTAATAEVIAYFNNAIEQTTEYVAANDDGIAFPFTMINNPINTGYPTTLGMASAVMGDVANGGDYSMIVEYAEADRQLWAAKGLDVQYGPMNSIATDPRWSKVSDTYGEDPDVSANIMTSIITAYQQGTEGVVGKDSIACIIKRFPGDGCSNLGFECHNKIGEWRLYPTAGSMEKYHLVPFQAAIDNGVSGVMVAYSRDTDDGVRSVQQTYRGVEIPVTSVGTVYNKTILQTLLRDTMGFKGFVQSDTSSLDGQAFGMEDTRANERIVAALEAGTQTFGENDYSDLIMSAVNKGTLDIAILEEADAARILPLMRLGRFDNPYVDTANAAAVEAQVYADTADAKLEAYRKQYVLLKNQENALPLTDAQQKVYVQYFAGAAGGTSAFGATASSFGQNNLVQMFTDAGYQVVENYADADIAFLYINPKLNNTTQIPVLDLVENLTVDEYDSKTAQKTGKEIACTTLAGVADIAVISETVHANNGKVIGVVNITNPWILTNFEPYCDGLMADFSASTNGMMDVLNGTFAPAGKLPVTLVSSNEVVAYNTVTENGVTYEKVVSPGDVPGYDKDQYIDPAILAQVNGGSYAYCDAAGNHYSVWFGLSY